MDIHLSEEAGQFIEAQLAGSGCRSPSEFVERLVRVLRLKGSPAATESRDWLRAQEMAAAKLWDNDADARYDTL
jgi:hypothetical protein